MSLRYADLLYLWLCAHGLLDQGVHGLLACPSPSSLLWFCKSRWVVFSPVVHTLRDGVTPAGSRLVCPRSERRFSHQMGQVSWSVYSYVRPTVSVGAAPLSTYGWASNLCLRLLFAPCHYRCVSWWSSLKTRVFGCS